MLSLSTVGQQQTTPKVLPHHSHALFEAVAQIANSPVGFVPGPEAVIPFYRESVRSVDALGGVTTEDLEVGYSTTIGRDLIEEYLGRWKQHMEPEHELQNLL